MSGNEKCCYQQQDNAKYKYLYAFQDHLMTCFENLNAYGCMKTYTAVWRFIRR